LSDYFRGDKDLAEDFGEIDVFNSGVLRDFIDWISDLTD
jgi:hypothetical protein